MITYIFPGQGSQYRKMGGTLFDEFKDLTRQADDILGYSIKRLCLEDPQSQLRQTQFTQPALFVVNAFMYLKTLQATGNKPDFVAGHSLGEYNALFAANAFDFATGLKLVQKRGELMSRATGGAMAAVIGLTGEQVLETLQRNHLNTVDVANYNTSSQVVISGHSEDIEKARAIFEAINDVKKFTALNVSGAFHSRYMREARQEFETFLQSFHLSPLAIPVISNVYARPYEQTKIKQTLAEQITSSIQWVASMRYLIDIGQGDMEFKEIGPGIVLTTLIQNIKREAKVNEHTPPHRAAPTKESHFADPEISASSLGNAAFKKDYNLHYAYLAGGMYRGIASQAMVIQLARSGMMGFFGTGGLNLRQIEEGIHSLQSSLSPKQPYGINLVYNPKNADMEQKTIDLLLKTGVRNLEASAFLTVTPALVRFHARGLKIDATGNIVTRQKIIAKISRPEVAEAFLSPAPEYILQTLLKENNITAEEAELSRKIPVADDLCVEADSAGHTDAGVAFTLMPTIIRVRDELMNKYRYAKKVRIGSAGGIGTPEAAMAAFMLGADFVLTGSINQCTVEAGTSNKVKDLLQQMNVQDTEYAPAGDMFEAGSKIQVLRKGVFFPARANKLYEIYRRYNSLDEIDTLTRTQLQEKYFKRSFENVYEEVKSHAPTHEIAKAEKNPKHKMALIFRWYFAYSSRLALSGSEESLVDYQVHCGPALGAFNQWVKGTELEPWGNRHVDEIGKKLMIDTAQLMNQTFRSLFHSCG